MIRALPFFLQLLLSCAFFFVFTLPAIAQQPQLPEGISPQDVRQRREELIKQGVPPEVIDQYLNSQEESQEPKPSPNTSAQPEVTDPLLPISSPSPIQDTLPKQKEKTPPSEPEDGEQKSAKKQEDKDEEEKVSPKTEIIGTPIYGREIFLDSDIQFQTAQSLVAPEDYIVGPGDQFAFTVTGGSQLEGTLPVQKDGSIFHVDLGKMYVAGLTYARARQMITERFRRVLMPRSNIEVLLGQNRRVISVNVVGEVENPGTYQVPATTTAFNALFNAGGINEIGSMRSIYIRRNGKNVQTLDIYEYLSGGNAPPVYLQDNDFIIVPVQKKVVEVKGSIKRPMRYELKKEENLQALLAFAGGLSTDALSSAAQVMRTIEGQREYIDFTLAEYLGKEKDFRLDNGDVLKIRGQIKEAKNFVEIEGAVRFPDVYELMPGSTLRDLIGQAGGLLEDTYLEQAYIVRLLNSTEIHYLPVDLRQVLTAEDTLLNPRLSYFDKVLVFSVKDFSRKKYIQVTGEVRKPDTIIAGQDMTLKALLFIAGGFTEDADPAYIELSKLIKRPNALIGTFADTPPSPIEKEPAGTEVPGAFVTTRVSTSRNWLEDPALDTLRVFDFDQVRVYSKYDFIQRRYLEIEGAVSRPGKVEVVKGMSLKDLLFLVGGFSENAEASYIDLYRRIDIRQKGINAAITDVKAVERISIDEDWQNSTAADSIDLFEYERIYVYSKRDFIFLGEVAVKGYVNKPGYYALLPNMSLKDLLFKAGGLKLEADYSQIELLRVVEKMNETGEIIPIPVVEKRIRTYSKWQEDPALDSVIVNSFDQVFVRKNPDFDLQQSVFISGEVVNPGEYNKLSRDETLSSIVSRAGGVTKLASLKGAFLERPDIGSIAIRLEKALQRPASRYDIPLLEGDRIVIPPVLGIVQVTGNVMQPGTIVQHEPDKNKLRYYVGLAGGFDSRTKKKLSTVRYPDGRVKRAGSFLFIRNFPKIEQGCTINIPRKPEKEKPAEGKERNKLEFQEVIAGITAILTMYLLIQQVKQ